MYIIKMEKYSFFFQSLLILILLLKIIFLICVGIRIYATKTHNIEQEKLMEILTDKLHKFYSLLMSIVLILLFSNILNKGEVCIDTHLKTYLSTFGILSFFDILHM